MKCKKCGKEFKPKRQHFHTCLECYKFEGRKKNLSYEYDEDYREDDIFGKYY